MTLRSPRGSLFQIIPNRTIYHAAFPPRPLSRTRTVRAFSGLGDQIPDPRARQPRAVPSPPRRAEWWRSGTGPRSRRRRTARHTAESCRDPTIVGVRAKRVRAPWRLPPPGPYADGRDQRGWLRLSTRSSQHPFLGTPLRLRRLRQLAQRCSGCRLHSTGVRFGRADERRAARSRCRPAGSPTQLVGRRPPDRAVSRIRCARTGARAPTADGRRVAYSVDTRPPQPPAGRGRRSREPAVHASPETAPSGWTQRARARGSPKRRRPAESQRPIHRGFPGEPIRDERTLPSSPRGERSSRPRHRGVGTLGRATSLAQGSSRDLEFTTSWMISCEPRPGTVGERSQW